MNDNIDLTNIDFTSNDYVISNFFEEFTKVVLEQLKSERRHWCSVYLDNLTDIKKEHRYSEWVDQIVDEFEITGRISWANVASKAFVEWFRENHPEEHEHE